MIGPTFAPVDEDTADLLHLISSDVRKADDYATFLRVCETDAECHGYVSVNRVRKRLSNEYGLTIHPRTYSAFWSKACRKGGPMVTTVEWETCDDRRGRNGGKPQRKRLWVG
jgi:hypothetical protein